MAKRNEFPAPTGDVTAACSVQGPKHHRRDRIGYIKRNYDLYLLLIPALLYILIFNYLPMAGITIAFKDYNIFGGANPIDAIWKSDWVGLKHFTKLFSSPDFARVFRNTLIISFYRLLFVFPLPILTAIMLNEIINVPFKRTIQTIIYLPHFLSWAVVSGIFLTLLGSTGLVNQFINSLGGETINFLSSKKWFRSVLIVTDAWKEVGWGSIIYLAAITAVDPQLYEAATIDGAGKIRQLVSVTMPAIAPTIIMMLILRVGRILDAGFEQIFVMYHSIVYEVADIIGTYVYREGLGRMNFSYGTAVGLFNSVVALVLVLSSNWLSKRATDKSIW
ncbi:MAG: sugar ABC transporter permease [Clostridiales bacterium]|nr:sugar ABC transporter permease [Clostridiales bacterium]